MLSSRAAIAQEADTLRGTVVNELGEFLFGATVQWEYTTIGTVADENGFFSLPKSDTTANLEINYVGYNPVYILVEPHENDLMITIDGITDLMTVEVAAELRDNYVSLLNPINVEVVTADEFRKAPCCNLAESFETNASIDVTYNDAVTGAREIQLLGLRGVYSQMLIENRPILTGLGSAFNMEYIPGTWLHSLQIAKGAGSVMTGYQAITGQLNTELIKPFEDDPLFINIYGSTFGRSEVNVHLNDQLNDKWSAGVLLHHSQRSNSLDQNDDTFYDTPQKEMFDGMLRLFYRGDVLRGQFNVHALRDEHTTGQIPEKVTTLPIYGINQLNKRVEFFGKVGYLGFDKPYNTIGFITNAAWHDLNSTYGNDRHQGVQRNFYANLMYNTIIGTTDHRLNFGGSFLYDDYDEQLNDIDLSRTEKVPGAFAEYTYGVTPLPDVEKTWREKIGVVAGIRADYHNMFGWLISPRVNMKYNFTDNSVARLSAGRGYRTANVIAENISILASNREVLILEDLDIEEAWNFGLNFTQEFKIKGRDASFALDLYRTQFNNQIIMDREHDAQTVEFYNLDGESFANSLLAVFAIELLQGLDVKVAYKFNDVQMTFRGHGQMQQPLMARHRGLVTLDYEFPNGKWQINTNYQLIGRQRFPHNHGFPDELIVDHNGMSPAYVRIGAQITRKFKRLEIYFGGENLTGYRQENPIIDWENPFGEYFDAAQTYAPITGAMGFIGLRFSLDRKGDG